MRIGERNVDRVKLDRVTHFAPVSGNHIRGRRQARLATELGHDLTPGKAFLRAARILGIGENVVLTSAQPHSLFQRPRAVRINRDARIGKPLRKGRHGGDLLVAFKDATFEFKILKSVTLMCGLGEPDNCGRCQGFLVAQPKPIVVSVGGATIQQVRPLSIADIEQIAEHFDG